MKTQIYVLMDEARGIRYVGKTGKLLSERLNRHLIEARTGKCNHRLNWIRALVAKGHLPQIQLIEEAEGIGAREEIEWIRFFRGLGVALVNGTEGGEGIPGHKHSLATLHKMRMSHLGRPSGRKGTHPSEETLQKMREAGKRRGPPSEETRQKLREAQRGRRPPSIETRRKMSESTKGRVSPLRGRHLSVETRLKMSVAQKGRKRSVETCAKIAAVKRGLHPSEETRKRMSVSQLARNARKRGERE